jgi:hypothetical protein
MQEIQGQFIQASEDFKNSNQAPPLRINFSHVHILRTLKIDPMKDVPILMAHFKTALSINSSLDPDIQRVCADLCKLNQ